MVEVLHPGIGMPVCCGDPMAELHPNTVEASLEKHLPVIRRYGNICYVMVGSDLHPMTVEHHIAWIEIHYDDCVIRRTIKPGDKPEAEFCGVPEDAYVTARAFCNLHGLWSACEGCLN